MLEATDWKTVAAVASQVVGVACFIPYIRDMLAGKTKPHAYTWLIWCLTFGTAAAAIWHGGGGGILAVGMAVNVVLVFAVFLLCFKYGTKDITRSDTIALIAAIAAIFVWWGLDNPLLALLLATLIDLVGYWPTYRKSWKDPWSEGIPAWVGYTLAPALTLLSLVSYNWLTTTYSAATLIANGLLIVLLVVRRRTVAKPV